MFLLISVCLPLSSQVGTLCALRLLNMMRCQWSLIVDEWKHTITLISKTKHQAIVMFCFTTKHWSIRLWSQFKAESLNILSEPIRWMWRKEEEDRLAMVCERQAVHGQPTNIHLASPLLVPVCTCVEPTTVNGSNRSSLNSTFCSSPLLVYLFWVYTYSVTG